MSWSCCWCTLGGEKKKKKGGVEEYIQGGQNKVFLDERINTRERYLTTTQLSSGCCHLVSRHQLTGQLLLLSASTQTPGLIKPQPRHSPINHLMMSYHGDHWAASIYTQGHIRAHTQSKGSRVPHTPPLVCQNTSALMCPYPAACLGGVRNMKTLMTVAFDSTTLILGAARISVWAKHLFSPLISNISLFHWNQRGLWTVVNGELAPSLLMLWAA